VLWSHNVGFVCHASDLLRGDFWGRLWGELAIAFTFWESEVIDGGE
jgi:hypothetical protein